MSAANMGHQGLDKKQFNDMLVLVCSLQNRIRNIHKSGAPQTKPSDKDKQWSKAKHWSNTDNNFHSMDDHTLLEHLKSAVHVLNSFYDKNDYREHYDEHQKKYATHSSNNQKLMAWYRNPRYRNNKKPKKDGEVKPRRARKPNGEPGAVEAYSDDARTAHSVEDRHTTDHSEHTHPVHPVHVNPENPNGAQFPNNRQLLGLLSKLKM